MSEDPTHQPELFADSGKPAAKKAAKKTAKKAAKKVAKKAAKKTAKKAAKKTAKKAAKKVASKAASEEKVASPKKERVDAEASPPAQPKSEPTRSESPAPAKEQSSQPRESDRQERSQSSEGGEKVVYGRVPGGGPVDRGGEGERRDDRQQGRQGRQGGDRQDRQDRQSGQHQNRQGDGKEGGGRKRRRRRRRRGDRGDQRGDQRGERDENRGRGRGDQRDESEGRPVVLDGPKEAISGLLEMAPKGFGFLRLQEKNFEQAKDDAFVSPDLVRKYGLRVGVWVDGLTQQGPRGPQLVEVTTVNGMPPEEARKAPAFEELKAINPNKRISFETTQDRYTTRVVDLISPVGRGQRGLIVSPPRSGKTTLLLHVAEAVRELHDESLHLMVLLVDERPEEVTEFRRSLPGAEIYASSNDEHPRNHTRIAEIAIERAKRLVEAGQHVFLLMDSITRLARAYNGGMRSKGRGVGSGGIMVGALETPRRLFAAARNTREAGSLTILATALVQTNSRGDEAIFQEFKGTGNMELVLDRKVAENYIYPAVDIFKSGTRREELLLPEHTLHKIHMIRRGLSGHRPEEAMERLLFFLKRFSNNPQMLLEIKG